MMLRDVLRHEILSMLDEFSRRLALSSGSAIRTHSTFNDAFLVRAYARGERSDGAEVAVIVDVKADGGILDIDSVICGEDGHIYKLGPSIEVAVVDDRKALDLFREWSRRFSKYLEENERYVVELLAG